MLFEILRVAFILMIAIPFMVMFYEVTIDIWQRFWGFMNLRAKPVMISVISTITRT